ncbi:hypothetical protein [Nocardia higoensis]|uniref:hypothetical protein n=1 Tax=Nocardia higoensis TaxID=228599 RepID=UPI0002E0B90F|nr:hypothetical protein [Nocardia higoensis]
MFLALAAVVFFLALLTGIAVHPMAGLVLAVVGLPFLVLGLVQRARAARQGRGGRGRSWGAGGSASGGVWFFGNDSDGGGCGGGGGSCGGGGCGGGGGGS